VREWDFNGQLAMTLKIAAFILAFLCLLLFVRPSDTLLWGFLVGIAVGMWNAFFSSQKDARHCRHGGAQGQHAHEGRVCLTVFHYVCGAVLCCPDPRDQSLRCWGGLFCCTFNFYRRGFLQCPGYM